MQNVASLHRKAMDLADQAILARRSGDSVNADDLTQQAFENEKKAAMLLQDAGSSEPTRSVLFRSAATLALECSNIREAERLISIALMGEPPDEIANELRDLLEQVYFNRHLELRGIALNPAELQVSLASGINVGFGFVASDELVNRVKDTGTLIHRTAERTRGYPYREGGRRKKKLAEELELYVSVPRAASFAVTLRIGTQIPLAGVDAGLANNLIDEILDCLTLVDQRDEGALREKITDDAYYRNFVGLAKKLAPDGHGVRAVGFTVVRPEGERRVLLATPRSELSLPSRPLQQAPPPTPPPEPAASFPVEIRGTLRLADSKSDETGYIELIDTTGASHRVSVPAGLMSDIVRPLYEERVLVTGHSDGETIVLENIVPDETEP